MSQENVEIVKAWYDAFNREDWDAMIKDEAPGFELDLSRAVGPWRGVFGRDQSRRFVVLADEFIDAGAAVLAVAHVEWRGKESGAEGTMPLLVAAWLRAGEVFRLETFTERSQALEAVGLSEQDAHADS